MRSLIALMGLLPVALAANAADWHKRSIYQVVTDRFARADGKTPTCDPQERVHCGGSYKGIENKLDYIQSMGFDAIWISPILENIDEKTKYGEAYHGYWPKDFTKLNTKFGSEGDLKSLTTALHERGMYLMVDIVVNHVAATSSTPNFSSYTPFSNPAQYHPQCWITDYNNQTQVEQCWVGDENVALVDVNTEDPEVVSTLNEWVKKLVEEYKVDGLRIDTVKHVRKDFWPGFVKSAGVFTLGEVLDEKVNYTAGYLEVMDSVFDYPTWFTLTAGFKDTQGDLTKLRDSVLESQKEYKHGAVELGSFLENHDQPRFGSLTNDIALIKNAMTWPFVHDGFPVTYYGQEQGYQGGAEPASREALWSSGYKTDGALVKHVTALNKARRYLVSSNDKYLSTPMTFDSSSSGTSSLVISKPGMLAMLTNVGAKGTQTWNVEKSGFEEGSEVVDVLSCEKVKVGKGGEMKVDAKGGEPRVWVDAVGYGECGKGFEVNSRVNAGKGNEENKGMRRLGMDSVGMVSAGLVLLYSLLY